MTSTSLKIWFIVLLIPAALGLAMGIVLVEPILLTLFATTMTADILVYLYVFFPKQREYPTDAKKLAQILATSQTIMTLVLMALLIGVGVTVIILFPIWTMLTLGAILIFLGVLSFLLIRSPSQPPLPSEVALISNKAYAYSFVFASLGIAMILVAVFWGNLFVLYTSEFMLIGGTLIVVFGSIFLFVDGKERAATYLSPVLLVIIGVSLLALELIFDIFLGLSELTMMVAGILLMIIGIALLSYFYLAKRSTTPQGSATVLVSSKVKGVIAGLILTAVAGILLILEILFGLFGLIQWTVKQVDMLMILFAILTGVGIVITLYFVIQYQPQAYAKSYTSFGRFMTKSIGFIEVRDVIMLLIGVSAAILLTWFIGYMLIFFNLGIGFTPPTYAEYFTSNGITSLFEQIAWYNYLQATTFIWATYLAPPLAFGLVIEMILLWAFFGLIVALSSLGHKVRIVLVSIIVILITNWLIVWLIPVSSAPSDFRGTGSLMAFIQFIFVLSFALLWNLILTKTRIWQDVRDWETKKFTAEV